MAETRLIRQSFTRRRVIRSYSLLILALDTTALSGSVAITRDDTVIGLVEGDGSRTHGERLPGEIDRALRQAGIAAADLGLLAVASGPGAFTGLRIGLAAIQGLAMVLGTPVIGVSALDALAYAAWTHLDAAHDPSLVTWMDAQRDEVFGAEYVAATSATDFPWHQVDGPIVASPVAILEGLNRTPRGQRIFVGDGALKYRADIEQWSAGKWRVLDPPRALAPAIAGVGRRLAARGAAGPPHSLQPLYVRRPDAEVERVRRTEP